MNNIVVLITSSKLKYLLTLIYCHQLKLSRFLSAGGEVRQRPTTGCLAGIGRTTNGRCRQ